MTRLHASGAKRSAVGGGAAAASATSPLKAHKEESGPSKVERETKGEAADDEEAGGQENAQLHANSPTNAKRPQGAEPLKSTAGAVNPIAELADTKRKPAAAALTKPAEKAKQIKKTIKRL